MFIQLCENVQSWRMGCFMTWFCSEINFCPFEKEANEGIEDLQSAIVFIKPTQQFFDGPN